MTSRYMRRFNRGFRPGQLLYDSYQFGAIGPNIAMAVGTCAAVRQGVGPQAPYQGAPVTGYFEHHEDATVKHTLLHWAVR